jgi:hypothetical protein
MPPKRNIKSQIRGSHIADKCDECQHLKVCWKTHWQLQAISPYDPPTNIAAFIGLGFRVSIECEDFLQGDGRDEGSAQPLLPLQP